MIQLQATPATVKLEKALINANTFLMSERIPEAKSALRDASRKAQAVALTIKDPEHAVHYKELARRALDKVTELEINPKSSEVFVFDMLPESSYDRAHPIYPPQVVDSYLARLRRR